MGGGESAMEALERLMDFEGMKNFYSGKRVLVTGHTGFKGAWLCKILSMMGAEVYGYSLPPLEAPNVFKLLNLENMMHSTIGDIRNFDRLKSCMEEACPEYVFHLAAQPIVRESYKIPRETFETNVMGTVNILECIRMIPGVKSFLNVTTDKVYENNDMGNHAFIEEDKLDGYDPYSNSKSCSELVTHSYVKSFFQGNGKAAISTARAGNVIGGGDFAVDRIIPDCVRMTINEDCINIRNPYSVRPYQHVLEPLKIYLTIVMFQEQIPSLAGFYNVGPDEEDCITTGELADLFVKNWGGKAAWKSLTENEAPHEANYLKLDCTKLKSVFGWKPVWHIDDAVKATVEWYKAWNEKKDINTITESQIMRFFNYKCL